MEQPKSAARDGLAGEENLEAIPSFRVLRACRGFEVCNTLTLTESGGKLDLFPFSPSPFFEGDGTRESLGAISSDESMTLPFHWYMFLIVLCAAQTVCVLVFHALHPGYAAHGQPSTLQIGQEIPTPFHPHAQSPGSGVGVEHPVRRDVPAEP